jgi:hypothetical protein
VSQFIAHYIVGRAQDALWWGESKAEWKSDDPMQAALERTRNGQHAIEALDNYLKATKLSPDFLPGWWRLSIAYSHRGDWLNALSASDQW